MDPVLSEPDTCVDSSPSSKKARLDKVTPEPIVSAPPPANQNEVVTNQLNDNDSPTNGSEPPMSKRAQKKLIKLAQWEVKKKEKRLREREKYRQKRAEAVALGIPRTTPSRKALKHNTMAASSNQIRVAIDLDFDDLMIDKDVCKCAKQLLWVYTINRKAVAPMQLFFTSLRRGGRVQQALDKNDGYLNWDVNIRTDAYDAVFERQQIVYLTSDSDTVLSELSADDVYVIGGLVDHNHHKGLSLERADTKGLRTARLPLGEHVKIKTRTVLTIVHGEEWSLGSFNIS